MATTGERQLKMLTRKKEALFEIIQNLLDLTKKNDSGSQKKFKKLYLSLETTRTELLKTIDEIMVVSLEVDSEFMPDYKILQCIDELYCYIKDYEKNQNLASQTTSVLDVTVPGEQGSSTVRRSELPKMGLPEFSGNLKDWESFYSLFKSLIHDNTQLSPVDKLYYLMDRLKGAAFGICAGVAITAENYEVIWQALLDKYHNTRALANNYLQSIINFRPPRGDGMKNVQVFLDQFHVAVRALGKLKIEDLSDFILLYIALTKLDSETIRAFELTRNSAVIPTYDELIQFLQDQSKLAYFTCKRDLTQSTGNAEKSNYPRALIVNSQKTNTFMQCIYCEMKGHWVGKCFQFLNLSPTQRYDHAKSRSWCYNCLSKNHSVRNCPSTKTCSECKRTHHTLLHDGRPNHKEAIKPTADNSAAVLSSIGQARAANSGADNNDSCFAMYREPTSKAVVLGTILAKVMKGNAIGQHIRLLLDSGSQVNLVTSKCCERLGLKVHRTSSLVTGLGKTSNAVEGKTTLEIGSRYDMSVFCQLRSLVVNSISGPLPRATVDTSRMTNLHDVLLADNFWFKPGEIDGIIGAEIFPVLVKANIIKLADKVIAQETTFGYVVMGEANIVSAAEQYCFLSIESEISVESLIKQFWELEEVPMRPIINKEASVCDTFFAKTVQRDSEGRYIVALPFKATPKTLGHSRSIALRRLCGLERKFAKLPGLKVEYSKCMQDFLDEGHLQRIEDENSNQPCFYIPHHAVIKIQSASTPVRIVLDASTPSTNGVSLNDILHCGPKLQANICSVLINFRLFKIALTADIRQMYRQIRIRQQDQRFQRLLWRFKPQDEIECYELTTVAFGLTSSPYLALRTVQELLKDQSQFYPKTTKIILRDLYMDDLITSVDTYEEAKLLYTESSVAFASGKFELTKWSTNSDKLLEVIPSHQRAVSVVNFEQDLKILGLQWNPGTDYFHFELARPSENCTKRNVLSTVARCYDPLGLVSPDIFYLKLMVKEFWSLNLDWDVVPPIEEREKWQRFCAEWGELRRFRVPRHISVTKYTPISLLGFADASNHGYGAAIYVRVVNNNSVSMHLLCAKSKVSPCRTMTIPRLELCAALLLSKLAKHVLELYCERVTVLKFWAFSDSTTVIQWLKSSFIKDIFVANRIGQIQDNLPGAYWRHIEGASNPADCLSRGLLPSQLVQNSLWIHGPSWALLEESSWPRGVVTTDIANRNLGVFKIENESGDVAVHPLIDLMARRSSWSFILRVTVRVLQFLKLIPKGEIITPKFLVKAEKILVRLTQIKHFGVDLLKSSVGKSSSLRRLCPFLEEGCWRVGGRLANSDLSYERKHPLLLPSKDVIIDRIVDCYHQNNFHTGPYLLEALIREKFWIINGRNSIRNRIYKCNKCFKFKARSIEPLMADLPEPRVQQSNVFSKTGVDYFGPISITIGRRRGNAVHKAWVCVFVCMCIKAVHLELVSSLSTDHFLQAFKRFLARRGNCDTLYSDQGTNFVGAKRILAEIFALTHSKEFNKMVGDNLAARGVTWIINPPAAPHMGGLWESTVKSVKTHLNRVLGQQLLTYEEFNTLLVQVEALLNSRPLCRLSADASAPAALTPAHFLMLSPLKRLPAEDVSGIKANRLNRFQLIDRMVQDYWKRWSLEYISSLQARQKWFERQENIKEGLVVLLRDSSPPLHWLLGVITRLLPGKDGIVRVIEVKTSRGVFIRPVVKICPLPSQ